ncbi:MAG: HEAT repeat domain-containing protein [Gammaproteobacteria bacterium]|nr:HEAT repeat domain-containing protein [Gammaproteobacteria bacterium]
MNFISALQAERLIAQISSEADPSSVGAKKAFGKLGKLGPAASPKILRALGEADKRQTVEYVEVLGALINDKTLPIVVKGLADSEPRTVSGTAWALSSSRRFNPNRLVDLLADDEYSKSAVIEILTVHKARLNVRQLLAQIYDLQPSEKTAVFKLVEEAAGPDLVPELLSRMGGKDPIVRMHMINLLAKLGGEGVPEAIADQLKDNHKLVRRAALTALATLGGDIDIEKLCAMLLDVDVEIINKAVDVITKINHPDTVKYLVPALKDENEFSRRAAVEVLNEIGNATSVKHLLEAVADEDWWVRARASDALGRIGGERVVDAVLELIKDKDEDIRRAAIEILNTCRDKRAVDELIKATADDDWWVSERAADALAEIGDVKALPAIYAMLKRGGQATPVAIRAVGKLGNSKSLEYILPFIKNADKQVKGAAIEAAADLAGDSHADTVSILIRESADPNDVTIAQIAARAIKKLEGQGTTSDEMRAARQTLAGGTGAVAAPPSSTGESNVRTLLMESPPLPPAEPAPGEPEPAMLDISTLEPGEVIEGRYKYIQKIGKGAFGTVLLVEDTVVDDRLILKFLNPNVATDEEMLKRFVHELRYSRKITHKNVIRIYDFLALGGGYAISMEYFPSHTLGAEIANEKPMDPKKAIRYACDICTGMAIAHHQGIVHRDLKPANILINDEGLLKIVDFGVAAAAKSGDTQLTKTGYVIGSPKYMAPEQILGKQVDERADIYSLGVILYEMLCGEPPYSRGDHMSVMYQHVQGKAADIREINKAIPVELGDIVKKAMSVDKLKRYDTMDVFKGVLEAFAATLS